MSSDESPPNTVFENSMNTTANAYLDDQTADVFFAFGDGDDSVRIPAHKILLAVKSDVFKAMFYGELKEKSDVKIVDVSIEAFKEFLWIFYATEINPTMENAADVLKLADKYNVAACVDIYVEFLLQSLDNRNVCLIYGLAVLFELPDLKARCQETIESNTTTVIETLNFLSCDRSILADIMELDRLSCSEIDLFKACMEWVKFAASDISVTKGMVEKHLGDLFYKFRFGSTTFEEFVELLPLYGHLFSAEEYQDVLQIIASTEDYQSKLFSAKWRGIESELIELDDSADGFSSLLTT